MNPAAIDWVAPLVVLVVGLGLGAVFLWRARRAGAAPAPLVVPSLELRDLAGKRDSLVRQLRELEDTASRWTEPLVRERYALELELARVLLTLEQHAAAAPERRKRASAPKARKAAAGASSTPVASAAGSAIAARPARRGFLWGAGSATALGLLLFFVSRGARPRPEGGLLTGDVPMDRAASAPAKPDSKDEEAPIRAALARDPDNLEAHLELARVRLGRRDMMGVWDETQYVLRRSPRNPRALSYQSLVHLAMGQADVAVDELKRALAAEPDLLDAYKYLAFVYFRMGREEDAEATIANATRRFPTMGPELAQLLPEMRHQAAGADGSGRASADDTRTRPSRAASARPAAAGRSVTLILDLEPTLRGQLAPGSVLFVTVREAGVEKGPPVAVKRLAAGAFPITVTMDDSDSMAGEPLPAEMRIEARVDSDGDPLTRSPSDPSARVDGVKAGGSAVRLVLKH